MSVYGKPLRYFDVLCISMALQISGLYEANLQSVDR